MIFEKSFQQESQTLYDMMIFQKAFRKTISQLQLLVQIQQSLAQEFIRDPVLKSTPQFNL